MVTAFPSAPTGGARLVSPACDPAEFVREAVAWDRGRLAAEVQRELRGAALLWDRSLVERTRPPRGCRSYVNFLARLDDWLATGNLPRFARRDTRELFLKVGEALVRRGQMDREALAELKPRPARRP